MSKILLNEISTTGELMEALNKMPPDTQLYPFGSTGAKLIYDKKHGCAYIDEDISLIDDLED